MKIKTIFTLFFLTATLFFMSCNNEQKEGTTGAEEKKEQPNYKEEAVSYTSDTAQLKGYVVYDENKKGKRPGILVVHEWWGLGDYTRMRAHQLAELGYIAMAIDMYGDGKKGDNPEQASALAMPFYQNPQLIKTRFDAALNKFKTFEQVDSANIGAIGYCYGGFIVLNAAKMGDNLKAVVSFHGSLMGVPVNKDLVKANILVCHGAADNFVPQSEVDAFRKSMDSAGVKYTFKAYENATHAFTNPNATEKGKQFNMPIRYNGAADTASWNDMKTFFESAFKVQ